jgi:hypothetical protein
VCVCVGGINETPSELSTEKYDPAEDTWTEIPAMNLNSYDLNVEVIDDMIFVVGVNFNGAGFFKRVAYFNDKENRWFVSLFVCFFV